MTDTPDKATLLAIAEAATRWQSARSQAVASPSPDTFRALADAEAGLSDALRAKAGD